MRALLALALALLAPAAAAQERPDPAAVRARVEGAVAHSGFQGVFLVDRDGGRVAGGGVGATAPGGRGFTDELVFPLGSVTKQVVATLVMEEVELGKVALDAPAARYLPGLARGGQRGPTVRELLQHRSGLRNPEDSPRDASGGPGWYTTGPTGLGWCLAGRGRPGGGWRYNNCDYLVLGAILEQVERRPAPRLFAERFASASGTGALFTGEGPDARADANWPGGPTGAERATLRRYGAAGGMVGTAGDVLAFDRALLTGALLTDRARAEMWRGDPGLGGMALGQWSFAAPLKGCAGPVRIVERRGGVGRFQARNVILPDLGLSLVMLTNRGDFDFGEIWRGRGPSYDVLSAAACP